MTAEGEFLAASERWTREQRDAWRDERLEELREAAERSPFWRARLHDATPVVRGELQAHGAAMATGLGGPTLERRTSGSTGRPVTVRHGPATVAFTQAARLRQWSWFGLPAAEQPQANIRIAAAPGDPPLWRDRDDPPLWWVNPYRLDIDRIHDELVAAGGVRVIGAESSLFCRWAELYRASGRDARELGAVLGIVGGEMTYPEQRDAVESIFGCAAAEAYGSHEQTMLAAECEHGSLHVNEELVWLELLRSDGEPAAPGEYGEVVITPLHNIEMPLLRYRLGDAAAWKEGGCPCGRTLARLEVMVGRLEEMVVAPDGRLLHPRFFRSVYERVAGERLRGFHTVQDDRAHFTAYLDVDGSPPAAAAIERDVSHYLGAEATVTVVPGPPPQQNGRKLRTFTRARTS